MEADAAAIAADVRADAHTTRKKTMVKAVDVADTATKQHNYIIVCA